MDLYTMPHVTLSNAQRNEQVPQHNPRETLSKELYAVCIPERHPSSREFSQNTENRDTEIKIRDLKNKKGLFRPGSINLNGGVQKGPHQPKEKGCVTIFIPT